MWDDGFVDRIIDLAGIDGITEKELECFGRNNIDIFIGGPPCQGFSLSGKRDVNDPRNRLFEDYLKIVNLILKIYK